MKRETSLLIEKFQNDFIDNAYELFGCFYKESKTTFRVYAPHAKKVSVIGSFNNWNEVANPMKKIADGIWEVTIPQVKLLDQYKYCIYHEKYEEVQKEDILTKPKRRKDNKEQKEVIKKIEKIYKQDPYAQMQEHNGNMNSICYQNDYKFQDKKWIKERKNRTYYDEPINIYEVHALSWKKPEDGIVTYSFLEENLIPYVKNMGYNYIELLPLLEYPYLGSWGYQSTGYFAPTSRLGKPEDFMHFIDVCHQNDIGVILDWVPAHFPKDSYGLCEFDGEDLYENSEDDRKEFPTWKTRLFDYRKSCVKSLLISSALNLFRNYHIDGLRVDAVAAMLYLDYDRKEYTVNVNGGNENLEAIQFLKKLNDQVKKEDLNVLMIAEESTAFPYVTIKNSTEGLGFNYKWNMGWMNDSLSYVKVDPYFKKYHHTQMTFAMTYAFSEHYILPISHDEVVHLKKSLFEKMPGNDEEKFANMKTFLMFAMTHPGKKLNFMGYEFAKRTEWSEAKELEWDLLSLDLHKNMMAYVKKLNEIYLSTKALYELDDSWDGFKWINPDDAAHNIYIYKRIDKRNNEIVVLLNFAGCDFFDYEINSPNISGKYELLLSTEDQIFGGTNNLYLDNKYSFYKNKGKINVPARSGILLIKNRERKK